MIDLGVWLLVRFDPSGTQSAKKERSHWLAFARAQDPATWRGLRVALYASAAGVPSGNNADLVA